MHNAQAYTLIGLTAIVAALVGVLVFAMLKFSQAARDTRRQSREAGGESAILSAALEEAVAKLKAQERAMSARAEASERLSHEIIASLTAGLLVVGTRGEVRIVNPAGRRLLAVPEDAPLDDYRLVLAHAQTLSVVIDESLRTRRPVVRRTVPLDDPKTPASHLGVTVSPLFHDDGELHGAICLFTDLTAVMDLEDQVRLKDSLARVGELTAGIAHEFRNGLATIHGAAHRGARRSQNHRGARGRRTAGRGGGARRHDRGGGIVRHDRGRRRAAAAGVQQPAAQCPRRVRAGEASAAD
jgi:nitrogen fixation/metabolism regulation signal transduction histidine kinase